MANNFPVHDEASFSPKKGNKPALHMAKQLTKDLKKANDNCSFK